MSHELRWYLSRLRAMSVAEVAHRSYRAARFPIDKVQMRTGRYGRPSAGMRAHLDHWQGPEPMEAAIRIHSLVWCAGFLRGTANDLLPELATAIYEHAAFVSRHRSQFSSANNHLIVELSAVIVAALALGGELRSLHGPAVAQLTREIERQVFADGVNAEMATHYHAFVLEALVLVAYLVLVILDEFRGERPPSRVISRYHFAPELDVVTRPRSRFCVEHGGSPFAWLVSSTGFARVVSTSHSDIYARSTPAPTVELVSDTAGPALITAIAPADLPQEAGIASVAEFATSHGVRFSTGELALP